MDDKPLRADNEIKKEVNEPDPGEQALSSNASDQLVGDQLPVDDDSLEKASEEDIESVLRQQLEECKAQADEYLDGWQRARAEFANARKRLEKQRSESYQIAALDFTRRLLPAIDDFVRAVDNVPEEIAQDKWFEGVTLVRKKLDNVLEDMNVEAIVALGQPFDPNFHEALSLIEADGFDSGTVVEELQTGYQLGELVIRPTLVNVAA
jgi:molecular chaperone GrpE